MTELERLEARVSILEKAVAEMVEMHQSSIEAHQAAYKVAEEMYKEFRRLGAYVNYLLAVHLNKDAGDGA